MCVHTCVHESVFVYVFSCTSENFVKSNHEIWCKKTGPKLEKKYNKAVYCYPAYFTSMQSTSGKMPGWMNHKLESRLLGEISKPQICRWHHPNGRKQRGTIESLDEGARGERKSWDVKRMWGPLSRRGGGLWFSLESPQRFGHSFILWDEIWTYT